MKKKVLSIFITMVVIFSLVSCKSNTEGVSENETTSDAATKEEVVATEESNPLIGISMPTHSDESWIRHADFIMKNLESLGYTNFDVQWAEDVVETQVSQIENLITKDAKVLIIAAVNGEALTAVLEKAADKDIYVIAYDRLIRNTKNINSYVTFDNYSVGVAEANYIIDKLMLKDGKGPFNIELFGGSSDDNNSMYFFDGAMDTLQPYLEQGLLVIKSDQIEFEQVATPGWDGAKAQARMDNLLTSYYSNGERVDAVLVPYDGLSIAVISSLKNIGYGSESMPLPIVTGQDAEVASVKSILSDEQTQTVWKDFRVTGEVAAKMADALLKGTEVPINDNTTYDNGEFIVPSFLCEVTSIDKSNISELFESGFYNKEDETWKGFLD